MDLYLDCDGDFMITYVCQNSKTYTKKGNFTEYVML